MIPYPDDFLSKKAFARAMRNVRSDSITVFQRFSASWPADPAVWVFDMVCNDTATRERHQRQCRKTEAETG